MTREEVFERLKELAVGEAHVKYNGGGDESTIKEISLYDAADCPVESDIEPKYILQEPFYNDPEGPPPGADDLAEALLAPLYTEIGEAFGDSIPSVYGRLVWDARLGRITLHDNYLDWVSTEKQL